MIEIKTLAQTYLNSFAENTKPQIAEMLTFADEGVLGFIAL